MSTPDRLDDFELIEEIGRGGFGIVYRAKQTSLNRPVALKVLYEHKVHTKESIARFEREAHAAARLDHTAIVSVYAWGQSDERFFIAQRLVGSGRTLADRLEELKNAGEQPKGYFREIAEGLAHIADGLQHAHERGIIHRDVKPSNILIDDRGRPCLGDFGLAKVEDGLALSQTGDMAGSPYYMSPEQADSRRGPVDHRCDIYSLGATLYELLALRPPFTAESAHEIVRKIINEEPKGPRTVVERVPPDLDTICLKALEKGRSRRYQSAAEFGADLRAFLDGEPISAVPASRISRVWRKTRRHRMPMALVAGALIVIALISWLNEEQRREQDQERQQESLVRTEADQTRRAVDERVSKQIDKALVAGDTEQARDLMEQRDDLMDVLDKARDLFVDTVTTGDKKLAEALSTTIDSKSTEEEGFSLVSGLESLVKAYEQQAKTTNKPVDPALQEANSLLERVRDNPITKQLLGLDGQDLSGASLPVRTPGVTSDGARGPSASNGSEAPAAPSGEVEGGAGEDSTEGVAAGAESEDDESSAPAVAEEGETEGTETGEESEAGGPSEEETASGTR